MWIDPANGDRMAVAHDDGLELLRQPRQELAPHSAADRADVSRRDRQPDSASTFTAIVRMDRRRAAPATAGSPNRMTKRKAVRFHEACGIPWPAARAAGRFRSDRQQHHLGDRHRLRQSRRHGRTFRRADASGARSRNLAGGDRRRAGGGGEVPLQLDVPARHLAARSQHDLRRQPARASHGQRRSKLAR